MTDLMHMARVGAAVAEAPLLRPGFRQCEKSEGHGRLGSFTLCLETAFDTMIVCRGGSLHGCSKIDHFVWIEWFLDLLLHGGDSVSESVTIRTALAVVRVHLLEPDPRHR